MAVQGIKYNNNSLQVSTPASAIILTQEITYETIADKTLNIKDNLIRDGFDLLDVRYSQKVITLQGNLISDTAANFYALKNTVRGYLRPNDQNLDVETYGGSTVYIRWKCSLRNFSCEGEHWAITQSPYSAEFICKPFGTATSATTIDLNSAAAITTTPYNEVIAITGTYNPKPVITITIGAETNMTAIRITNTTTLDWIEIARSFSVSDILIIDCDEETVKVNGVPVDFTGTFISFIPSSNSLSIFVTDTGAFSYACTVIYYLTYL